MRLLKLKARQEVEPVAFDPQARVGELNRQIRGMRWHEFGFYLKSGRSLGSALVSAVGGGLAIRERHKLEEERDALQQEIRAEQEAGRQQAETYTKEFDLSGRPVSTGVARRGFGAWGSTVQYIGFIEKDMEELKKRGYSAK